MVRNQKALAQYEMMIKAAWSAPCGRQNRLVALPKKTAIFFIFNPKPGQVFLGLFAAYYGLLRGYQE